MNAFDELLARLQAFLGNTLVDDGLGGYMLQGPGVALRAVESFLEHVLDAAHVLQMLAPPAPPDAQAQPSQAPDNMLPLELNKLTLTALTLSQDGDAHELSFELSWPLEVRHSIAAFSPCQIELELERLCANVFMRCGGQEGDNATTALLLATLRFNKVEMDVSVQLPALIFEASLADAALADAKSQALLDHLPATGGDARLAGLDLMVALRERRVMLHFAVEHPLTLGPFALEYVEADAMYDANQGGPSGRLWASIDIALVPGKAPLEVALFAELTPQKTWAFEGRLGPDGVNVQDLVTGLVRIFSCGTPPAVPDTLALLDIKRLALSYDSGEQVFHFTLEVALESEAGQPALDVLLDVVVTPRLPDANAKAAERPEPKAGHAMSITSQVLLAGFAFDLFFSSDAGVKSAGSAIQALVGQAHGATEAAPIELSLQKLLAPLVGEDITAHLPALTLALKDVSFLRVKQDGHAACVFGIDLGAKLSLGALPLVGHALGDSVVVDGVQVFYATGDISDAARLAVNPHLSPGATLPAAPPAQAGSTPPAAPAVHKGFNVAANLKLGAQTFALPAGAAGTPAPTSAATDGAAAATPATPATASAPSNAPVDDATWIALNKTLGPMTVQRIGTRYADQRLWLLLSAEMAIANFTIGLDGLGIGFKVGDWGQVEPTLTGLSLAYSAGPLDIQGAFKKLGADYLGTASIKAASFALSAVGAYGEQDGQTTLFLFALCDKPPLGGPPFFYITGLAAGFGYNRDVRLPSVDEVKSFPLLSMLIAPQDGGTVGVPVQAANPMATLDAISAGGWLPKAVGQNWLAIGVRFTSFEMVQSFALAIVKFGVRFEVAITGLSQMSIPPPDPETGTTHGEHIAYSELAFSADLVPDEGILRVDGKLTPASYILVKEARLLGGFAFYVWFDGDFVLSFGGYHPHFERGHYPDVPRLGIDFHIGSALHVTAQAYFALTPSAIMAGGRLDALYETGPLKAWFNAGADFLAQWKPFHYEASLYLRMGASLTLDLAFCSIEVTVELGADLSLWGPPLGGTAHISYSVASFTIAFGADKPAPPPLTWEQFRDQFLPAAKPDENQLLAARVTQGLVRDLSQEKTGIEWLINPTELAIEIASAIPATEIVLNNVSGAEPTPAVAAAAQATDTLVIAPMGNAPLSSRIVVTLMYHDAAHKGDPAQAWDKVPWVHCEPVRSKVPRALWSAATASAAAGAPPVSAQASVREDTLVGLLLRPQLPTPHATPDYALNDFLFDEHEVEHVAMCLPEDKAGAWPLCNLPRAKVARPNEAAAQRRAVASALSALGILPAATQVKVTQLGVAPRDLVTLPLARHF